MVFQEQFGCLPEERRDVQQWDNHEATLSYLCDWWSRFIFCGYPNRNLYLSTNESESVWQFAIDTSIFQLCKPDGRSAVSFSFPSHQLSGSCHWDLRGSTDAVIVILLRILQMLVIKNCSVWLPLCDRSAHIQTTHTIYLREWNDHRKSIFPSFWWEPSIYITWYRRMRERKFMHDDRSWPQLALYAFIIIVIMVLNHFSYINRDLSDHRRNKFTWRLIGKFFKINYGRH